MQRRCRALQRRRCSHSVATATRNLQLWARFVAPCESPLAGPHPQAGRYERATALLIKHGWWQRLLALMRSLDPASEPKALAGIVDAFRQAGACVYTHMCVRVHLAGGSYTLTHGQTQAA